MRPSAAWKRWAAAALLAPSAFGCGGGRQVAPAAMVVALASDVDAWNPYVTQDATSAELLDLLYPRLLVEIGESDGTTRFEPWLAASWEFRDAHHTLVFRLRPDARWSHGRPVDCEDVRFTFAVQVSDALAWPGAYLKERIESVECADPRTVVFRFREPYADQLLDANDDAVVPREYGEVPLSRWASTAWKDRMRTCGPFRLAAVDAGQQAVLERDPGWWGARDVALERVVLRVFPDSSVGLQRFLDGDVDLVLKIPPAHAERVEQDPGLELVEIPSLSYAYLAWNVLRPGAYLEDRERRGCDQARGCRETAEDIARLREAEPHPILSDARVRRALTLAVDREDLVRGLWRGRGRPGTSPILSTQWAYEPEAALRYDPDTARRLLEEAGWRRRKDTSRLRDGKSLRLQVLVNADNRMRTGALERVRANLRAVGVEIVPEPLPRREFVRRARDKDFDAILGGWSVGTRIEVRSLFHTESAVDRGNNLTAWGTPESDALLDRASREPERERARPLWRRWQLLFREEQPVTILYEEARLVGRNRRFTGPPPSFVNPFQNLHRYRPTP